MEFGWKLNENFGETIPRKSRFPSEGKMTLVLYRIKGENDLLPNAVIYPGVEKEVYLFDILSLFLVNQTGINYSFWAYPNLKEGKHFTSHILFTFINSINKFMFRELICPVDKLFLSSPR